MSLDVLVESYPEKMREILQYHIVPFEIESAKELADTFSFPTLVPGKALFGLSEGEIDGIGSSATILDKGVKICSSVVYTVSNMLLPGTTLDEIGHVAEGAPKSLVKTRDCDPESNVFRAMTQHEDLSVFLQ